MRALGLIFLILLLIGGPVAVFIWHDEIAQAITRSPPKTDDTTPPPAQPAVDYTPKLDALATAIDNGNKTVVDTMTAQTGELKKALTEVSPAISKEIEAKFAAIPAQVAVQVAAVEKLFKPIGDTVQVVIHDFGHKAIGFGEQLGNKMLDLIPGPNCPKVDDVCEMDIASLEGGTPDGLTEAPVGSIKPLTPSSEEPVAVTSETVHIDLSQLNGALATAENREAEMRLMCPSMDSEIAYVMAHGDFENYKFYLPQKCGGYKTTLVVTSTYGLPADSGDSLDQTGCPPGSTPFLDAETNVSLCVTT